MTADKQEIAPCPHCGSAPFFEAGFETFWYGCSNEKCRTGSADAPTKGQALANWQRIATAIPRERVRDLLLEEGAELERLPVADRMQRLGPAFRLLRKGAGLTMGEVARHLGVSVSVVSALEVGRVNLEEGDDDK